VPKSICLVAGDFEETAKGRGIGSYCSETARLLSRQKWKVTVLIDGDDSRKLAEEYYEHHTPICYTDHLVEPSERAEITSAYSMGSFQTRSRLFHAALLALMNESKLRFDLIEFSDWGGTGFIPTQMKMSSRAYENSRIIVKLHGPSEWRVERDGIEWTTWEDSINDYTERYSFENADVQGSVSGYLLDWCRMHDWKVRSDATVCPFPFRLAVRSDLEEHIGEHREIAFVSPRAQRDIDQFVGVLHRVRAIDLSFPQKYPITFVCDDTNGQIIDEDFISRRLEPYHTEFHTFHNREETLSYLKRTAKLTVLTSGSGNGSHTMLGCMMNRIPFVAIRPVDTPEILAVNSELYATNSADKENLPMLILNHLAYDKHRIQHFVDAAYQQARIICDPVNIVQWYEERLRGQRRHNQLKVRHKSSACVTVIIPTRNASKYLDAALRSLTGQTYKITKVVIKDSSTEQQEILRTRHLAKKHGACMVHRNDTGIANAMNQTLKYVDTKYLVQFDADNIAMPHMIETFVRAIELRNDVAALSSYNAQFYDEDEPRLLESLSADAGASFIPRFYYRPVGPCLPNLFIQNVQGDATSIYLTKVVKEIGGWPEDTGGHQDWLMWLKLVEAGRQIDAIPEVLYYYRIRPDSLSRFNKRTIEIDHAQISIIKKIIRNQPEVFSRSYSSIHRLLRRNESLERHERELEQLERELDAIRQSLGYRFMRFYAMLIDRLLPDGTSRGQFRKMMTAHVQRLTDRD